MTQTEVDYLVSLSLSANNWAETYEQSGNRSAQSSASCRRSGRSPALPYPPHEYQKCITLFYQPFQKGTFLLCRKGDISILQ